MDIKEIIKNEFGFAVHDLTVLGQGLDSMAYLVYNEYVFKQAKHDEARIGLQREELGREFGLKVLEYYHHPDKDIPILKADLNEEYYPIELVLGGQAMRSENMYNKWLNKIIAMAQIGKS